MVLFALKHNIDRLLAAGFGYPWSPVSYWVFITPDGLANLKPADEMFYVVLLVFAVPFIWIGTVMTLRRLRDADLPLWLVMLFFVPFLNVIFLLMLAAIPSRSSSQSMSNRRSAHESGG